MHDSVMGGDFSGIERPCPLTHWEIAIPGLMRGNYINKEIASSRVTRDRVRAVLEAFDISL